MPNRTRPLIVGLSPRILRQVPPELGFRGKTLQYLEQSIAHWAMAQGALLVMMPTLERQSLIRPADIDICDYADVLDALILQGGADLDPSTYGETRTELVGPSDPVRDQFELELLRAFAAQDKPVLGICRGMQLINVAFGGSLYQDLNAGGATSCKHQIRELYDDHTHTLCMTANGWLATLYGGVIKAQVNSIHHQGVKQLGNALVIEAWSEDGIIECIRHSEQTFVVGVQWHPEFHDARYPNLLSPEPLMQAFLQAAQRGRDELNALQTE